MQTAVATHFPRGDQGSRYADAKNARMLVDVGDRPPRRPHRRDLAQARTKLSALINISDPFLLENNIKDVHYGVYVAINGTNALGPRSTLLALSLFTRKLHGGRELGRLLLLTKS